MSSDRRVTKSESLQDQVARNIRNDIEAGVLRHGQVLPSTRDLAEQWGVSVFTVNEAMKILAKEGLVTSKSRSKRLVHNPDQQPNGRIALTSPHVIFVGGYAGSGKTELGRILARQTHWPMLDKDTLTRPVVEAALETLGLSPHDRESDAYLNLVRPREYESLMAATYENVECGTSAIVTAPFVREFGDARWIERTQASLASRKVTSTLAWVQCDADTMHTYIRHRGAARDAAKLADWGSYLGGVDLDFRPQGAFHLIGNSANSRPLQGQAIELLEQIASAMSRSAQS